MATKISIGCYTFEVTKKRGNFSESKENCREINGSMISNLLGNLGTSYHK